MTRTGYLFGIRSCHCVTSDCCDSVTILNTGPVICENYYNPQCCAYVTFGIYGSPTITMPVGINGVWTGASAYVSFSVTSTCVNSFYIDYINAGSPAEHEHLTTNLRSILMDFGGGVLMEVLLDAECCPTSVQTYEPEGFEGYFDAAPTLAFGPTTVAGYFEGGYDLVICEDAPLGVCCVDGASIGTGISEYNCEVCGDGITPGTWYAEGTYDPEDPCSGDPWP